MSYTFKKGVLYSIELDGIGTFKSLCIEEQYPVFRFSCEGGKKLEVNCLTQAFHLQSNRNN